MGNVVAIRRETKSPWERRAPLTPEATRKLVRETGLEILVQPSARRVFHDKEYVRAGATLINDLSEASIVLGVKEVPPELLGPATTYVYFAHVIKGQPYNMPMLARLLELGCTLVDYEMIRDDDGRRLVFFGRFAGLAGMVDALSALGRRLAAEGLKTPLAELEPAHAYPSLAEAKQAVQRAGDALAARGLGPGLDPLVVGVAGYGNVARGAREILAELDAREVEPEEVAGLASGETPSHSHVVQTTFREQHLVRPRDPRRPFELSDYYDHPERYEPCFSAHLPNLHLLVNCNYWDERYPRLVTLADLERLWDGDGSPRLRVIADLSCDIGGGVECTVRCTEPGNPVYVYEPASGRSPSGVEGDGPVVLAVDILPSELPREASEEFSSVLSHFLPALARADFALPFAELDLPPELRRAVITHRGELTPDFAHLATHLPG